MTDRRKLGAVSGSNDLGVKIKVPLFVMDWNAIARGSERQKRKNAFESSACECAMVKTESRLPATDMASERRDVRAGNIGHM